MPVINTEAEYKDFYDAINEDQRSSESDEMYLQRLRSVFAQYVEPTLIQAVNQSAVLSKVADNFPPGVARNNNILLIFREFGDALPQVRLDGTPPDPGEITETDAKARLQVLKNACISSIKDPNLDMIKLFMDDAIVGLGFEILDAGDWKFLSFAESGPLYSDIEDNIDLFFDYGFRRGYEEDGTFSSFFAGRSDSDSTEVAKGIAMGDLAAGLGAGSGLGPDTSGGGGGSSGLAALGDLDLREQNQCLLMSLLYNKDGFLHREAEKNGHPSYTQDSVRPWVPSTAGGGSFVEEIPYHDRIIPFMTDIGKIEKINNYFYSDGLAREFFQKPLDMNSQANKTMRKGIYYVYESFSGAVGTGAMETYEKLLPLTNDDRKHLSKEKIAQAEADVKNNVAGAKDRLNQLMVGYDPKGSPSDVYKLDNITIKYEGTNPSTARNDVTVDITFILGHFAVLNTEIASVKLKRFEGSPEETKSLKLRDLVLAPIIDDGAISGVTALKNNYSPKNNRIRLKVFPTGRNVINSTTSGEVRGGAEPIILDLTTIDHSISRSASDGIVTFTIHYRGFLQSMLNMPYADALLTREAMDSRQGRLERINRTIREKCEPNTIRELMRVERASFDAESKDAFGAIIGRIMAKHKIYEAIFTDPTENGRLVALSNLPQAGTDHYVVVNKNPGMYGGSLGLTETDVEDLVSTVEGGGDPDPSSWTFASIFGDEAGISSGREDKSYFFCFGDLLNSIIDNIYEENSSDMSTRVGDLTSLRLKFMTMPIVIPDPRYQNDIVLNPALIPIDLYFFAEWYNSAVVKKDLKIYPVGAFGRDILERLINDLLYEVCISHILPDEKPPALRMSYFSGPWGWTNAGTYTSDPAHYSRSRFYYDHPEEALFSRQDPANNDAKPIDSDDPAYRYNYCVFYQQSPPFQRELNSSKVVGKQLRDDEFVPTLVSGRYSKGLTPVKNVSFSKNTAPFLREARFFNNSFGSLALMNNVYDLKFEISDYMSNSYFYPGILFNFILTDFEKPPVIPGSIAVPGIWASNYQGTDNDPHHRDVATNNTTTAHVMGFGGYYVAKTVEYNLGANDNDWKIIVDSKFLGTDADSLEKSLGTTGGKRIIEQIQTDSDQCRRIYDESVRAYEDLSGDTSKFEREAAPPGPPLAGTGVTPSATFTLPPGVATTAAGSSPAPGSTRATAVLPPRDGDAAKREAIRIVGGGDVDAYDPDGNGVFTFTAQDGYKYKVTYKNYRVKDITDA